MQSRTTSTGFDRRTFVKRTLLASLGVSLASCARSPVYMQGSNGSRQAGALLTIDIPGTELDAETAALIRDNDIRSILLFQRNLIDSEQTRRLTEQIRTLIGPNTLIAIDQEGGAVVRTRDFPYPPSAMSLGAANSSELAFDVAAALGRGLKYLGINWNYAPPLDVNNNPLNPVISDRSFGGDPHLVARIGLAWVEGLASAGVAACVKHFPGHGDTAVDSHLGLPIVDKDRATLDDLELYPFRQAVQNDVPSIMTAHIVFPAFDRERPATLSRAILNDLLRDEWDYDGVVVTDAMNMEAITEEYGRGEAAVMALTAGSDLVLAQGYRADQIESLRAVDAALKSGTISPEDWARSVRRTTEMAQRFPADPAPYSEEQRRQDAALFERAWAAGLTAYRDARPPARGSKVLMVVAGDAAGGGASERGMRSDELLTLLRGVYDLSLVTFNEARPLDSLPEIRAKQGQGVTTIFASTGRHRPNEAQLSLIRETSPNLHLALWNPYAVLDVAAPALISYGFRPEALRGVVAWLRGDIQAQGRAPIELEGGV